MARYYEETALLEFVNLYTPTINGETTMKCVERAIRAAPTANVAPMEEVERLNKEVDRLSQVVLYHEGITQMEVDEAKVDTVKKMQERLDKHFCHDNAFLGVEQRLIMDVIDQIAKEMLEGQNEQT